MRNIVVENIRKIKKAVPVIESKACASRGIRYSVFGVRLGGFL